MPLARRNDLGDSNYAGLEVDVCHDLQRCLKVRYRARDMERRIREGDGTAVPSPPPPSPPPPAAVTLAGMIKRGVKGTVPRSTPRLWTQSPQ